MIKIIIQSHKSLGQNIVLFISNDDENSTGSPMYPHIRDPAKLIENIKLKSLEMQLQLV